MKATPELTGGSTNRGVIIASSGGTSSPHGRPMPVVWYGKADRADDLNSHIAASSGWYLRHAVDINRQGQILCIGERASEKEAEAYRRENWRYVVLTPALQIAKP